MSLGEHDVDMARFCNIVSMMEPLGVSCVFCEFQYIY